AASTTRRDPRRKPSFKSGSTRLTGFTGLRFADTNHAAGFQRNPEYLENHVNPVKNANTSPLA
ncbi:MAG: hypothetical protein WCP06_09120, partial [Verrucomicrobiota bacterium]